MVKKYEGHNDFVHSVVFNYNSKFIASGSRDKNVILWDTFAFGKSILRVFKGHEGCVNKVMFSINGKLLYSCSNDKTIRIWYVDRNKD